MQQIDLSIVTYHPDMALLEQLLTSLAEGMRMRLTRNLFIHDNSADAGVAAAISSLPWLQPGGVFARVDIQASGTNLGFGRGHNANAARGTSPMLFVLNQDCVFEQGALEQALASASEDDERIGAWEMRQIPYEHPKEYDPATLDTPWASAAALLLRRTAFEKVGGFEPRIFMYGEDVDLSWRLRAGGWRVVYRPRTAVVHRTYANAHEEKPAQLAGNTMANLCLRARYGGLRRTFEGLALLGSEIRRPQAPERRRTLLRAGWDFLMRWPYFATTRVRPSGGFQPHFDGWAYERRRDGAFHPFASRREGLRAEPVVSILIRTVDRPRQLAEALASCANQTYRNLDVMVVEDGRERSRAIVESFRDRLAIRYHATGEKVGRARAGNIALANARGEWVNFLDDDDVFFADHVEVLVAEALRTRAAGVYGLAWESPIHWLDERRENYREGEPMTRFRVAFDRFGLWHQNYLPIQAVLFHRRLWQQHGGFLEDMDQLEDWNLWTRYTLTEDFVLVPKTTSKYRVPGDEAANAERFARLRQALPDALERQRQLQVTLSPRQVAEMARGYVAAFGTQADSPVVARPTIAASTVVPGEYRPKVIRGARFANQKVLLDGYEYSGCEFVNVTFEFNGTTPIRMVNNRIDRPFRLSSANPMVLATITWLHGLDLVRKDLQVQRAAKE
jgi:GT2 family glycosyltransferase